MKHLCQWLYINHETVFIGFMQCPVLCCSTINGFVQLYRYNHNYYLTTKKQKQKRNELFLWYKPTTSKSRPVIVQNIITNTYLLHLPDQRNNYHIGPTDRQCPLFLNETNKISSTYWTSLISNKKQINR